VIYILLRVGKGEVVNGYINYKKWRVNPENIEFSKSAEGKTEVLGIDDLQGFHITGSDYYERHVVMVDELPAIQVPLATTVSPYGGKIPFSFKSLLREKQVSTT
jgi:hypothetical protein